MLFSVPKEPFPELISFTFKNPTETITYGEYQAEDGMTFRQWAESSYNVDRYKFVNRLESPTTYVAPYLVTESSRYYIEPSSSQESIENERIVSGAYFQHTNI